MQDVVMQILYTAEEWIWMRWILQIKFVKEKSCWIAAGTVFIVTLLIDGSIGLGNNASLIWMLNHCVIYVLVFCEKMGTIILKYLFSVFYMNIISNPVRMVFLLGENHQLIDFRTGRGEFFYEFLVLISFITSAIVINRRDLWKQKICEISNRYYAIGMGLGFCASGIVYFVGVAENDAGMLVQDLLDVMCVMMTEFVYFFGIALIILDELRRQYQRENLLKEQYLSQTKAYYYALENHITEVRRIRHDMKFHLSAVSHYLSEGQAERAREYLEKENAKISATDDLAMDVGNPLINAVIAHEKRKMGKDVSFFCEGAFPKEWLPVSEYDLCAIFSNLLANAGEACGRLREKKKEIFLWIGESNGKLLIQVENPIEWEIDKEKLFSYTSKKDAKEHGYGLLNVKESVEQNGGEMEIDTEDEKFSVRISFAMTGAGQSEQDS